MPVPDLVLELVATFQRRRDEFKAPQYNEQTLRKEFIEPFFEALGWDVYNKQSFAEAYKDVVHEESIRIAGVSKSPDYSFRLAGARKFFVEAKKPSVNLKDDPSPAYQLRRYAWSAKLPVSNLTDFEEFAVYDTRVRPTKGDQASKARVLFLTLDDYAQRWDELVELFSPDGIKRGGLDRYARPQGGRRGTSQVDDVFLKEMEAWREALAKNIALRNSLTVDELNYAVQMTIDRIVFLRIAEDRGLEPFGQLRDQLSGSGIYKRLLALFRQADARYNSGLFHFGEEKDRNSDPDDLTTDIAIDDKALKDIIGHLYYPESPYEFSVLPADILGQVYEQFLGKVIRLTSEHRAVVEDKPEVKKAGGVYYTPSYVVDYIVEMTVGPLLYGKRPKPATKDTKGGADLKILDPACGSGSFLLGAYQFLLNWHRDWYVGDGAAEWAKGKNATLRRAENGEWRLTPQERRRILLNSIYGVDIDAQAVEVTKLSLLLKVLEGETQLGLFHERILPDLDSNIRRGNSLLESDFGQQSLGADFSAEDEHRLSPFRYSTEFGPIFKRDNPGFDAVIGNPPYVLLQWLGEADVEKYLKVKFESARYKINTYQVFMERGVDLIRSGGRFGYITPSSYLRNKFSIGLREVLLRATCVDTIRIFSYPVFKKVSEDTCITLLTKNCGDAATHRVHVVHSRRPEEVTPGFTVLQSEWQVDSQKHFGVGGSDTSRGVIEHIEKHSVRLGDFATAYFGIQTRDRDKFVATTARTRRHKPVIDGVHIEPYGTPTSEEFVDFDKKAIKSGGNATVYARERIGVRQIGETPVATLLPPNLYTLNTIYNIYFTRPTKYDLRFILAVICSEPLRWYWRHTRFDQKKIFPKIKKEALLGIPVPRLDFSDKSAAAKHDQVVALVDELLSRKRQLTLARLASKKATLRRRIDSLAEQIDGCLVELWALDAGHLAQIRG